MVLVIVGLACGFVDSSLGMGYGVTSASVLVSFGIAPALASASVHSAEAFIDTISAGSHLKLGNVRKDILVPMLIFGTFGAVLGAAGLSFLALNAAKPIVSLILLIMGSVILIKFLFRWKKGDNDCSSAQKDVEYSKRKISLLSFIAGFVDASGGGGWGPILTPAFVATGSNPRKAIGTVEFTEPIISLSVVITFGLLVGFETFLWNLVLPVVLGGVILTPLAAYCCSKIPKRALGILVGAWIVFLNIRTLLLLLL
jgi:uncharacterized membrane protein YfcA